MMKRLAFVPTPQKSESFHSWIRRLANEYNMYPEELLLQFDLTTKPDRSSKTENFRCSHLIKVLSEITGVSEERLCKMSSKGDWHLTPSFQTAFCPKCWFEDQSQNLPFYIRRRWCKPTYVVCECHSTPLQEVYLAEFGASTPFSLNMSCTGAAGADTRAIIERLEKIQTFILCEIRAIQSLQQGVLSDVLRLLARNFSAFEGSTAVNNIMHTLQLIYWKVDWPQLVNMPLGTRSVCFRGVPDRLALERVPTVGYRRLLLLTMFIVLPGLRDFRDLPFRECFQSEALQWLSGQRKHWCNREFKLLARVARKVAL